MSLIASTRRMRPAPLPGFGLAAIGCFLLGSVAGALGHLLLFPVTIGLWAIAMAIAASGIIRSIAVARNGDLSAPMLLASLALNACAALLVGTGIWQFMAAAAEAR